MAFWLAVVHTEVPVGNPKELSTLLTSDQGTFALATAAPGPCWGDTIHDALRTTRAGDVLLVSPNVLTGLRGPLYKYKRSSAPFSIRT